MPYIQTGLPFAARSHTSYRAAVAEAALERRAAKTQRYLEALAAAGARGLTDHEAHVATGLQISSVCSIRNATMHCGLVVRLGTRVNPLTGHQNTVYAHREAACLQ